MDTRSFFRAEHDGQGSACIHLHNAHTDKLTMKRTGGVLVHSRAWNSAHMEKSENRHSEMRQDLFFVPWIPKARHALISPKMANSAEYESLVAKQMGERSRDKKRSIYF